MATETEDLTKVHVTFDEAVDDRYVDGFAGENLWAQRTDKPALLDARDDVLSTEVGKA